MELRMQRWRTAVILVCLLCVLAACNDEPETPPTPTAAQAAVPTLAPTITPAAAAGSTTAPADQAATTDPAYAGLPDSLLASLPTADVAHGGEIAVQRGCTACHSMEKDVKIIGPTFYNIGQTAAERIPGESAGLYLYNSIIHPNDYVVESFLSGLMPQNYAEQLSEAELAELVAYLLSQQAE